jgi:ABC-type multidrug transport system fused ATPase/permease subunit
MRILKELWFLFERPEKKRFIKIIILSSIVAFLEMLSVAAIIPFFSIVLNFDEVIKNQYLANFLNSFGDISKDQIILFTTSLFIIIFTLKNFLVLFFFFYLNKFLYKIKRKLSDNIFQSYLYKDYEFYLKNKISQLISNINSEVHVFMVSFLQPFIIILSELLVCGALLTLLFFLSPYFLMIGIRSDSITLFEVNDPGCSLNCVVKKLICFNLNPAFNTFKTRS